MQCLKSPLSFFLLLCIVMSCAYSFAFVAKGAATTHYSNTTEVVVSSETKESTIQYEPLVWQIAIYFNRLESGKSFDALTQLHPLLTIKLKNKENSLTIYRLVSDENGNYMIHHDEKCFRIDRADYLMFCHLLEASIPAVEQTYITVNERTGKIDANDAILIKKETSNDESVYSLIKKETSNDESVYSAYLIPEVYTSNTIHHVCISAKYSTLYELLTQDENILAIRDNVVWFFPIKKYGLSSEDINCIVQYVIHNRLNSNGIAWEILRVFYSYAIEHNLLD